MAKGKALWHAGVNVVLVVGEEGAQELYDVFECDAIDSNLLSESVADWMWEVLTRKIPEFAATRQCGKAIRVVRFTVDVTRKAVTDGQ